MGDTDDEDPISNEDSESEMPTVMFDYLQGQSPVNPGPGDRSRPRKRAASRRCSDMELNTAKAPKQRRRRSKSIKPAKRTALERGKAEEARRPTDGSLLLTLTSFSSFSRTPLEILRILTSLSCPLVYQSPCQLPEGSDLIL